MGYWINPTNLSTKRGRIDLSHPAVKNKLWWCTHLGTWKSGSFTVKSCYNMLQSNSKTHHQVRTEEAIKVECQMWKKIWAANIPSKIRVFIWRVCHGIIPVFTKLHQWHIDVQTTCPRCQRKEETTIHALRDCKNAEDVWKQDATTTSWFTQKDRNIMD